MARVIVMNDGEISLDGTPEQVFENVDLLSSIGLSVPKPLELAVSLRNAGIEFNASPLTPGEFVEEFKKIYS